MALTKDERELLQDTHDAQIQIRTVLLGVNGDEGLVGEVRHVINSHNKLKNKVYWLIGILAGSGIGLGSFFGINGG